MQSTSAQSQQMQRPVVPTPIRPQPAVPNTAQPQQKPITAQGYVQGRKRKRPQTPPQEIQSAQRSVHIRLATKLPETKGQIFPIMPMAMPIQVLNPSYIISTAEVMDRFQPSKVCAIFKFQGVKVAWIIAINKINCCAYNAVITLDILNYIFTDPRIYGISIFNTEIIMWHIEKIYVVPDGYWVVPVACIEGHGIYYDLENYRNFVSKDAFDAARDS